MSVKNTLFHQIHNIYCINKYFIFKFIDYWVYAFDTCNSIKIRKCLTHRMFKNQF